MWYDNPTQYPLDRSKYHSGELPWFAGMWNVGVWCERSYIFDPMKGTLYERGYGPTVQIPPIDWPPHERRNILQLVCPD